MKTFATNLSLSDLMLNVEIRKILTPKSFTKPEDNIFLIISEKNVLLETSFLGTSFFHV